MAILDRIKYDGLKSRNWIVYKYPSDSIAYGSQLIVSEGQAAIVVKNGVICDVFPPGAYNLDTSNLPVLQAIINLPYGNKTPFSAEVYFINTINKIDVLWGTSDPIQVIDPKYFIKLKVRAFGQMGLKIDDYVAFFTELIGAMGNSEIVEYDKVVDFYRGMLMTKIKTVIANIIINEKISALELSAQLDEISQRVHNEILLDFERFGFSVSNFYIQSINFPDSDFEQINKILEERAKFEIMGDARYQTKRSFDVYESAAKNENGVAGAFASGGIGIGVGMNVAKQASQNLNTNTGIRCSNCNAENSADAKFCFNCGSSLEEKFCVCGEKIIPGSKFCSKCGASLEQKRCKCGQMLDSNAKFCPNCGASQKDLVDINEG